MNVSQGSIANFNGNLYETTIENVIRTHGVSYRRQHPLGNGIYGSPITCDFYLPTYKMVIECKWQDSAGSADEKLPYIVENADHFFNLHGYLTVIVIDGKGFRHGAVSWLRAQFIRPSIVGVFDVGEFISWAAKTFRK